MTNLPSSEHAYQSSIPEQTQSLNAAMTAQGVSSLSSFAGVVFMAHFFGRNLNHLHRPSPDEREDDLQGDFWKRHRNLDNILLRSSLSLPSQLRLPTAIRDPNAIFIKMAIHSGTIRRQFLRRRKTIFHRAWLSKARLAVIWLPQRLRTF